MICSPRLASLLDWFRVMLEADMNSDHFPICASFNLFPDKTPGKANTVIGYNFNKAKWDLYTDLLSKVEINADTEDLESLSKKITSEIMKATEKSVPRWSNKRFNKSLPKEIFGYDRERKLARNKARKIKEQADRNVYNHLSNKVKQVIKKLKMKVGRLFWKGLDPISCPVRPFGKR